MNFRFSLILAVVVVAYGCRLVDIVNVTAGSQDPPALDGAASCSTSNLAYLVAGKGSSALYQLNLNGELSLIYEFISFALTLLQDGTWSLIYYSPLSQNYSAQGSFVSTNRMGPRFVSKMIEIIRVVFHCTLSFYRGGSVAYYLSSSVYVFGGYGFNTTQGSIDALNDMWVYNITLNLWSWLGPPALVRSKFVFIC